MEQLVEFPLPPLELMANDLVVGGEVDRLPVRLDRLPQGPLDGGVVLDRLPGVLALLLVGIGEHHVRRRVPRVGLDEHPREGGEAIDGTPGLIEPIGSALAAGHLLQDVGEPEERPGRRGRGIPGELEPAQRQFRPDLRR